MSDNCRASHTKCDGAEKCVNCHRKNLKCVYSKAKRRGRKATNGTASTTDLVANLPGRQDFTDGTFYRTSPMISSDTYSPLMLPAPKRQRIELPAQLTSTPTTSAIAGAVDYRNDEQLFESFLATYRKNIQFLFPFAPVPPSRHIRSISVRVSRPLGLCSAPASAPTFG